VELFLRYNDSQRLYNILTETNIVKQKAQWGNKLWINHYYTGSLEDWKRRLERGAFKERFQTLALFYKYNPDMKK